MTAELVFLRHAEPEVRIELPPSQWGLSKEGKAQNVVFACTGVFDDVQAVYSSSEKKAYHTAVPLAIRSRQRVNVETALNELNRDQGLCLSTNQYRDAVRQILRDRNFVVDDWESATRALSRFRAGVSGIAAEHPDEKVLIVTHGIVMTLYFSNLLNDWRQAFDRWSSLKFLTWGVVKDFQVVKDLM